MCISCPPNCRIQAGDTIRGRVAIERTWRSSLGADLIPERAGVHRSSATQSRNARAYTVPAVLCTVARFVLRLGTRGRIQFRPYCVRWRGLCCVHSSPCKLCTPLGCVSRVHSYMGKLCTFVACAAYTVHVVNCVHRSRLHYRYTVPWANCVRSWCRAGVHSLSRTVYDGGVRAFVVSRLAYTVSGLLCTPSVRS